MNNQFEFATLPTINITRSKFNRNHQFKATFNLGDIVPIFCDQLYPSDTFSINMAEVIRMSNPIRPIMDNIKIDYYAFFIPNRLCWTGWKKFNGENESGYGAVNPGSVPMVQLVDVDAINPQSIGDYIGIPSGDYSSIYDLKVSALPGRAYALVYNRFFRDQNVEAPIPVYLGDDGKITTDWSFTYSSPCLKAYKFSDYFTRALPYAQKSFDGAVALPLGTKAPVVIAAGSPSASALVNGIASGTGTKYGTTLNAMYNNVDKGPIYADLRDATAATVNELRFAVALQRKYEKDALYGTRYAEICYANFGVRSSDSSLQDPELIAHVSDYVNINQVLQTTGFDDTDSSELGQQGAISTTGGKHNFFTYSATEHGMLMIVAVARHDQTYTQGIARWLTAEHPEDWYLPVYAHLGAQDVLNKELDVFHDHLNDVFGYQEAWSHLRYSPSRCAGFVAPHAQTSLATWTLANKFDALPTLGKTFLQQGRENISRCLVTGSTGPDFLCDIYFKVDAIRPLPVHSIPGYMDHF